MRPPACWPSSIFARRSCGWTVVSEDDAVTVGVRTPGYVTRERPSHEPVEAELWWYERPKRLVGGVAVRPPRQILSVAVIPGSASTVIVPATWSIAVIVAVPRRVVCVEL